MTELLQGFGWTANLVYNNNYAQKTNNNIGRLSGTGLVSANASGATAWHVAIGGRSAVQHVDAPPKDRDTASVRVEGIALRTAQKTGPSPLMETASVHVGRCRTFLSEVVVVCDRAPTVIFSAEYTTTGHVLKTSAQIPSFLDASLQWATDLFATWVGRRPVRMAS